MAARDKERADYGATTQQLEPDLKRSLGGLRDLHLIRWIGFALHDAADIDSLRLHAAITMEESRRLVHAHEFLTGLRIDLHLEAGKEQDLLTREDRFWTQRDYLCPLHGDTFVKPRSDVVLAGKFGGCSNCGG